MICLFFWAPSFVTVIYGPKWILTVKPLQLLCISTVIYCLARSFFPVLMSRNWVYPEGCYTNPLFDCSFYRPCYWIPRRDKWGCFECINLFFLFPHICHLLRAKKATLFLWGFYQHPKTGTDLWISANHFPTCSSIFFSNSFPN